MKRRDFLGAPVALVGMGLAAGGARVAQAAGVTSTIAPAPTITTGSASFALLRLVGSALETAAFGDWQEAWPQVSALSKVRVVVHGLVRGTTNTLGTVNVETAFFSADGKVNTALVYATSDTAAGSGSGAAGFYVHAPHFGGFVITPSGSKARNTNAGKQREQAVVALGDGGGRLAPGLYAMVHKTGSKAFDASQYVYTGYNERPLVMRNGRPPDTDYLAFSVEEV
jgi:hypothetical protein